MAWRASNVVDAGPSDAGNSRNRWDGGASSVISLIRVSSIGLGLDDGPATGAEWRRVVEVGTERVPEGFCSQNNILPASHRSERYCATTRVAAQDGKEATLGRSGRRIHGSAR